MDERLGSQSGEPIAIVGMACRFPGAPDVDAFWRLLERGENAITEGVPGSGVGRIGEFYSESDIQNDASRFGAFIDGIDQFDAEFFRISPVEAQLLDPQQRLMLETSWQALEDAGIDPERLKGSRSGVYIGISNMDYRFINMESSQTSEPAANLYTVSGTSLNTAAGRVAFALGLEGPAMAVDTACSSSLVAIHQSVSALQRGEANLILAGGVQVILSGRLTEFRANARMLSPDGQCKAFDASANGFVRGEGCGLVVLKRLSDAEADGDRIWSVILGSALNQDGTSTGLTVPNERAQAGVIADALDRAGVAPSEVDYLEAHGTGTEVGDPIELNAAAAVYGEGRNPDRPLLVGSVKTNIGHLEPTAGVAGLMKTVLSIQNRQIPKHLHFRDPNPRLDWDRLPVKIASELTEWPARPDRPPRAGISAYGWSGTNAHVIVEGYGEPANGSNAGRVPSRPVGIARAVSAPLQDSPSRGESNGVCIGRPARLLPLSAKSNEALQELSGHYLSWLDGGTGEFSQNGSVAGPDLADMAWTAGEGRSHFDFRAGVVFRDIGSLRANLAELAASDDPPEIRKASKVAFAYTGQGVQWLGMGEALYQSEPVARAVLDRCDQLMREERGASLLDVMFGRPEAAGDLDEPAWTQPAVYALECALTALWASVGIRPDVVVGHSLGEIAAAHTAGVFSLEDGLRFACTRGELLGSLPRAGAMAAVFAPASRVSEAVDEWNEAHAGADICVAVDNGMHQVVSGPKEEVHAFSEHLEASAVNVTRLRPSPAYHSPLVEPALDDLESFFSHITINPPALSLISNMTGGVMGPDEAQDGPYWRRHAREPVAFRDCVATLAELGVDAVVELGPHRVLGPLVSMNWPEDAGNAQPPVVLQSLLRPSFDGSEPERADAFVQAVAGAYEAGLPVSFAGLFAGETRRRVGLPGYPFQRRRHWVKLSGRRHRADAHPLLGVRHESPRGEMMFETEMSPFDPDWLDDHRVYGRVVMPGAVYGAMAASVSLADGTGPAVVEDLQLHNPLVFPEQDEESESDPPTRRMQLVLDPSENNRPRHFEVFSKGETEEAWTLHAEGSLASNAARSGSQQETDLEALKAGLQRQDLRAYYQAKASTGIDFGPRLLSLEALWGRSGEAVGDVVLQDTGEGIGSWVHPLLLDGCFQVLSAARDLAGMGSGATYLPFAWERLSVNGPLPERLVCHARMREVGGAAGSEPASSEQPETLTGDLWFYDSEGTALGELSGFIVKRATRAALLSASAGLQDMLYETVWRESPLLDRLQPADALAAPSTVATATGTFGDYLAREGVSPEERSALLDDLERLSRAYALAAMDRLGWERRPGATVDPESLREQLKVLPEHSILLERILRLMADAGILDRVGGNYLVKIGSGDPLPDNTLADPDAFNDQLTVQHPHGSVELGLLRRSGGALAPVLQGDTDPLSILFPREGPGIADYYFTAPASRATNQLLGDAVASAVANWPEDRPLRILEVGAGTGSGTSVVLPELQPGNFTYMFTDISAGFFAEAENRFGDSEAPLEYRALDIERNPCDQGFDLHAYDLVIAVNVLHATRNLGETLANCRELMAPSGKLIAVENLRGRGWQDMVFGQLDGWWRFSDEYRPDHALASPQVWRRALADTGFVESAVLGGEAGTDERPMGSGVVLAEGPPEVTWPAGAWVVAGGGDNVPGELASALADKNQAVVLAVAAAETGRTAAPAGIQCVTVDPDDRNSWLDLLNGLPEDLPLRGVVHCFATGGHGVQATTQEMAEDVRTAGQSALTLAQALQDADVSLDSGFWLVTEGAQALERDYLRESAGNLAGASLWGLGRVVAREAAHLCPRMLDLDPADKTQTDHLVNELMFPDPETQVAYRDGHRLAARLVRSGSARTRLDLPEEQTWRLMPDAEGALEGLHAEPTQQPDLQPGQVRVEVEAAGVNFLDVLLSLGVVESADPRLGEEFCGRVVEAAPDVTEFAAGDRVIGLAFGTFGPEVVTQADLVAPAPEGMSSAALATIPSAFVSAGLSFEEADLKPGDRVLIHTASGGVGLAAVQLAQAAGLEVFATASAPKRPYLRSLGIEHVFDSRTTGFGREILEATGGVGVNMVLNSLTGPGFIEDSLSCLADGGSFVEMGRRDIWNAEEMAAARPDVFYYVLELDWLKKNDPARPGSVLRDVMQMMTSSALKPLAHTRWPIAEAGAAMGFMQSARHIGKNVLVMPPVTGGQLRPDRTYLVTGGMGGIGIEVAKWLADLGAGVIVLNGRRPPDDEAEQAIEALRQRGADVRVELADMTDPEAVDAMLARIDAEMPDIAGVIHSVGVLSDAALGNQTWERFEQVLWPKILGAWHLHRATLDRDLDLFVLFSSITGVLGNSGQGNHAAANTFLDQLAEYRRSLGLPGQAIAWGAWSGLGEAEEQRERIERQLESSGTGWISPNQGLDAFDQVVRRDLTSCMVAAVDWPVFTEKFEDAPKFLEDLITSGSESEEDDAESSGPVDLMSEFRQSAPADRQGVVVAFVQQELQAVMRMPSVPAPTVGFFELGMDSLVAVEFRNRLNRSLAGDYVVSNTAVFDYPTVDDLARHLSEELNQVAGDESPEAIQDSPARATVPPVSRDPQEDAIAIVGMACRFPGAPDLSAYWDLLEAGRSAITDGRQDRGTWDGLTGDPAAKDAAYRRGGFVEGLDQFDARFFRIAPIEARMMDPQQRMLLETSWQALEDAAINPDRLRGSRTGVYAGVGSAEYRDLIAAGGQEDSYLGTAASVAVGRVAFALGLEGPAMPVDLACASSLAAVHQAAEALRRSEVDLAIAGGVNATLSQGFTRFHKDIGMLSASGHCNAFDAAADGYIRGEGCGVVVLKRLGDAEADGDRIWGLIRGSAVNQNGASAALTVPNGPAQERVMEAARTQAGVNPSDVDYLEAHAVGSQLGDPIELNAVASVYGRERDSQRPLLIGTVKSNIGHVEWAAGIAGFIKTVLSMKKGVIPESLHFKTPNPNVNWEQVPVKVTSGRTVWPTVSGRAPLAGVNAFGLSGANAHVLVEGYGPPEAEAEMSNGARLPIGSPLAIPASLAESVNDDSRSAEGMAARATRLLPLSGKSEGALRDLAGRYLSWLGGNSEELRLEGAAADSALADMAWTAGEGRSHFEFRSGLVFRDAAHLQAKLEALAEAVKPSQTTIQTAAKVAFLYGGQGGRWKETAETLYLAEPVVREVLDRCDRLSRDEMDFSLLEAMFGQPDDSGIPADLAWQAPAVYAFECALTELWAGVGVRPTVVLGRGTGEIAAAQAAGVLTLEDGLRVALQVGRPESSLPTIDALPPALTWVSSATGRVLQPDEKLDQDHWRNLAQPTQHFSQCIQTLSELHVDAIVEVGTQGLRSDVTPPRPESRENGRKPVLIESTFGNGYGGFVKAVGAAYEAGLSISFKGLFAGETRRRVSLPAYPFQRKRFWI